MRPGCGKRKVREGNQCVPKVHLERCDYPDTDGKEALVDKTVIPGVGVIVSLATRNGIDPHRGGTFFLPFYGD